MPTFSTLFSPPPAPSGISATAYPGSRVRLAWTASTLSDLDFVGYHVYRSLTGESGSYVRLSTIVDKAASWFEDYEAPLDVGLYYQITQESVDHESAPGEVTSELDVAQWWLVTPGAPEQAYELHVTSGYDDEAEVLQTKHKPLGRSRHLVEKGELLGIEGGVTITLKPEDRNMVGILRAISAGEAAYVLLKTPFGEVYRVSVGTVRRSRLGAGLQRITFPVTEVA